MLLLLLMDSFNSSFANSALTQRTLIPKDKRGYIAIVCIRGKSVLTLRSVTESAQQSHLDKWHWLLIVFIAMQLCGRYGWM